MGEPRVLLLHAIDTEGPLYESPSETVSRLNRITGLSLDPDAKTFGRLRTGAIDLGDKAEVVANVLRYSTFLGDWSEVRNMLSRVMSPEFRSTNRDSDGCSWVFNWHVMDHIGYDVNPRRRDIGYHNVFDVYQELVDLSGGRDEFGFHFHPAHYYPHAHLCGTNYDTSPHLFSILARRLIDRNWFPRSFRAGFHTERPDSHAFLEQWIPHDFSNQSIREDHSTAGQLDLSDHRFGDWQRAPDSWGWYHPHHDDYQRPGQCRRRIFRCLNIGTRHRCISVQEIQRGFDKVLREGEDVVMSVTNHDFRDIGPDVEWLKQALDRTAEATGVKWSCSNITDSFRQWHGAAPRAKWNLQEQGQLTRLSIKYSENIFGPQPFMAVKLLNEAYHHVNLDIVEPFRHFTYVFDENTVPISRIQSLVIGTNDRHGNVLIDRIKN